MLQSINEDLLVYLNSFTNSEIIKDLIYIFADLPIFFLPIFLIVAWIYYSYNLADNSKKNLLIIFYATILSVSISMLIQQFIYMDRPEVHLANIWNLILEHIPDASFPSDHASVSVAFLVSILLFGYKKIFWIYLPFVVIMLLSRVSAWVHWPFDILAWIIVWIISSMILFKLRYNKLLEEINNFLIKLASYIKL